MRDETIRDDSIRLGQFLKLAGLIERRERFGISSIGLSLDAIDAFAPVVARLEGQ